MLKLFIKQGLHRRKEKLFHYICIMLGLITNILFFVFSGSILCIFLNILKSDWHRENGLYMQTQAGDVFFLEKSGMMYRCMIFLCVVVMLASIILALFLTKIWSKEIVFVTKIYKYLGYNRYQLFIMHTVEYLIAAVALMFVVIPIMILWIK